MGGTTITANTPTSTQTKMSFTDNDTEGISIVWDDDDTFSVYASDGGAYVCDFSCMNAASGAFNSMTTLEDGVTYTAVYPASGETTLADALAADLTSNQDGDEIDQLNAACMMTTEFTYTEGGDVSTDFEHLKAVMTFKFTSDERPAYLVFQNANRYTVNYTSIDPVDGVYTSHIMIEPCNAAYRYMTFNLYDSEGAAYYTRTVASSKAYVAGYRYTASFDLPYWEGSGSESSPYLISNEADLVALSTSVNSYNNYSGKYFEVTNNIELTSTFSSIGCSISQYFSGVFDGGGFKISGLDIVSEDSHQGLFGYTQSAVIRNLSVDGKVTGAASVGGVVGNANGTHIVNCHSSVEVEATGRYVGGVVGTATENSDGYSYIVGCYFDGSVNATAISGDLVCCGGVVGNLNIGSAAYGCYSTIAINGTRCGGVFGAVYGTSTYSGCYYDGDLKTWEGLDNEDDYATALTTTEMTDGTLAKLLNNGLLDYSGDVWAYKMSAESEYPVIDFYGSTPTYSEPYWSGTGTEGDPYIIETADQLRALSSRVVSDKVTYSGTYFALGDNIDLGGIDESGDPISGSEFTPIGNLTTMFCGSFDGANYEIEGLYITGTANQGLFGYVSGSSVSNLSVYGYVSCTSNSGGIVGSVSSSATITNCHNYVDVSSSSTSVGGIVGYDYGGSTISGCTNSGTIYSTYASYDAYVGGIVGRAANADASISDCHNYGDVTVSDGQNVAGILGYCGYAASVTSCSNSGTITAASYAGGVMGNCEYIAGSDCHNSGAVTVNSGGYAGGVIAMGAAMTNCSNSGDVEGNGSYVAGVIAYATSDVSCCFNSGYIKNNSASSYSGGVAGRGSFLFTDCYNTGSVEAGGSYVGGITSISSISANSTNCYNIGEVSSTSASNVNGVIGFYNSMLSNCYYLSGTTADSKATEKSEAEMTGGSFALTLGSNWKEDYEGDKSINNGYPILSWQ